MDVKGRGFVISAVVGLVSVAVAAAIFWPRGPRPEEAKVPAAVEPQKVEKERLGSADAEYVVVGGVRRKASDLRPVKPATAAAKKSSKDPFDYGHLPGVKPDTNPQVKAVADAIRQKKHPERLSVMARGAAFDPKAYKAAPKEYLETVEPGRVFQTAQPGPGVPHLAPASDRLTRITQGQTAKLRVQAPAGSPVSFTSFDTGRFENLLTAQTVQANAQGIAEVTFEATPGTIEDVNILAGSPVASGQVKFVVNVQMPEAGPAAEAKK